MSDPAPGVRTSAATALGKMGPEGTAELIKLLSEPDAQGKHYAARALGESKAKVAAPYLIKLLFDPAWIIRAKAAWALGEIGPEEAVGPLIACLDETLKRGVRDPAAEDVRLHLIRGLLYALHEITGESFGDIRDATTDAQREQIVQKWLKWWQENREEYEAEGPVK
jgi:HEAT repeat protein